MPPKRPGFFERRRIRKVQNEAVDAINRFCERHGIPQGLSPNQIKDKIRSMPNSKQKHTTYMKFELLMTGIAKKQ